MATYEELFAEEQAGSGAHAFGGFNFPSHSPKEREARNAEKKRALPKEHSRLSEVLKESTSVASPLKKIAPLVYAGGSPQEKILLDAVAAIGAIRIQGKAVVAYDPDNPEPFFDACADTARTAQDVEQSLLDPAEAAIAAELFKLAGFYNGGIRLLTDRAKVEIQIAVIEKAKQVKYLFARQAELSLTQ